MTNPGQTPVRVYRATDAPPGALAGEVVAVLGYGHLGRTAALNLRDSGAKVRIGNRDDEYAEQARSEGFEVVPIAAAATGDVAYVSLRAWPATRHARAISRATASGRAWAWRPTRVAARSSACWGWPTGSVCRARARCR